MNRLLLILPLLALGFLLPNQPPGQVSLAWDASPSPEVTGYYIYWGVAARSYTNKVETGNVLTFTVTNLVRGVTYYFSATAHDASGLESDFCNEVTARPRKLETPPNFHEVPKQEAL